MAVAAQPGRLCTDTLRFLSVAMVQKADSGHPGLPLGAATMAYVLWARWLGYNPHNPHWFNRDRLVVSAGHGAALQSAAPDRLRPCAGQYQAVPPIGQQDTGTSRARILHAVNKGQFQLD